MKRAVMGVVLLAAGTAMVGILVATTGRVTADEPAPKTPQGGDTVETTSGGAKALQTATFGGGCFWCVEAVFQEVKGVEKVVSGYAGGRVPNPTYEQVCTGLTGHAEVVQITYDPDVITYPELLEIFWKTHDPTTRNRQGNDIGPQYRSIILAHDEEQLRLARAYKEKLNESGAFRGKVVTEIVPLTTFYPAEAYHQNYYRSNPYQGYCQFVIVPKLDKFRRVFREKLKE